MNTFLERRDFTRLKANTALTLSYSNPVKYNEGVCTNLSDNGIAMEVERVIPLGTECKVTIHDGRNNHNKYQALIEITRIEPLEDNRFLLGARVLEKF